MNLTVNEIRSLVDKIGPSLGYDMTYKPVFPEGRKDVAVVKRLAENGSTYGFDTIYLVWKDKDGKIHHREIANSRETKDYIHIESVTVNGNEVTVKFGSGGSYSGTAWKDSRKHDVS
jgi:hypothetical protein